MQELPENLQKAIENRRNKNTDPVSEAAMEIVTLDQNREQSALVDQEDKEQRIAESYEIAGRIKAFTFIEKVATVATLVQLKQIKESKVYRDLPGMGTWQNYCDYIGLSRRKVDEDLQNLEEFGEQFLATVASFSLGYRELRKLRKLTGDGTLLVSDNEVQIGDERIPFSADNREDLQAALERLIEAKDAVINEKEATLRANQKIIDSKQDLIRRQEKDLAKYEKEAEANGLSDPEKVFIQKVQNARVTIEGFLNQFDPQYNPLPEDATPKMKAELMLTLQSFVRSTRASYDTAAELYGDADLDGGGWVPPNMRTQDGEE
jgi:hypothetical protein